MIESGKFSLKNTVINVVAGLGLISFITIVCDFILLNYLSERYIVSHFAFKFITYFPLIPWKGEKEEVWGSGLPHSFRRPFHHHVILYKHRNHFKLGFSGLLAKLHNPSSITLTLIGTSLFLRTRSPGRGGFHPPSVEKFLNFFCPSKFLFVLFFNDPCGS